MGNVYRLSDKDRRRCAVAEPIKIGHGGVANVSRIFECSRESMDHGISELIVHAARNEVMSNR